VQKEENGIDQIQFEDQDHTVKRMYAEDCARNGVTVDM